MLCTAVALGILNSIYPFNFYLHLNAVLVKYINFDKVFASISKLDLNERPVDRFSDLCVACLLSKEFCAVDVSNHHDRSGTAS